ncbi:putative ubiquinone biosynthesis monooxygenase, partial [Balamuthia mandrillaris]
TSPLTKYQRVALVESAAIPDVTAEPLPPFPDIRVSALSPGSVRFLHALGAWDSIANSHRATPYDAMKVWDATNTAQLNFNAEEVGTDALGYIVENKLVVSALFQRLKSLPSVKVIAGALDTIQQDEDEQAKDQQGKATVTDWTKRIPLTRLRLKDGKQLKTRLLVGADGAQSKIRKTVARFPTFGFDYSQRGVVASIALNQHTSTAWQRFLASGPVAMLPMFADNASIVWSTSMPHSEELLRMPENEFIDALNHAFHAPPESTPLSPLSYLTEPLRSILPNTIPLSGSAPPPCPPLAISLTGKRAAFPLKFMHANKYIRPRLALIGDAAHCVHPLAGQGVNLGFADVVSLSKALAHAVESGRDVGDQTVLQEYEDERKNQNLSMLLALDAIKRIFETNSVPLAFARSAGITLTNVLSPIKSLFVGRATGQTLPLDHLQPNEEAEVTPLRSAPSG